MADKEEQALNKAAEIINKSGKTPSERQELLNRWKKFVTENKLAFRVQEDVYLKVEAWNYLFSMNKLSATITDISRVPDEDGKTLYIAKAALMPMSTTLSEDGVPLGVTAFGACKVGESEFCKDEFAALSMAQTRAVGKLGRTAYAHLAIACGYKATPLEEMSFGESK